MIKRIEEVEQGFLTTFNSNEPKLDEYLVKYALKNSLNNISKTYLLEERKVLIGYVTLAAAAINLVDLPKGYEGVPRYPIPAIRIARLAIDYRFQKKGYGKELLKFALKQSLIASTRIGIKFVIVDAKENAKGFYEKYGFIALPEKENTYILPIETVLKIFI